MKKILVTLVLNALVTIGVVCLLIFFAQDAYPASALYNLKRVGENIESAFQFSNEAKANNYIMLAKRRKSEIEQVYKEEQYQHILITSLRYVATTGNASEFMVANNLSDQAHTLQQMMEKDIQSFEKMSAGLPEDNEDGRFFTDAINYTRANIQKLENL